MCKRGAGEGGRGNIKQSEVGGKGDVGDFSYWHTKILCCRPGENFAVCIFYRVFFTPIDRLGEGGGVQNKR
jgi:hypothetical protein